jgi:hypothetical protein
MASTTAQDNDAPGDYPPRPACHPEAYFPTPTAQEGVFDLALVLGGTVSAGTFTAGVLDFLFEALDEWDKARQADPDGKVPKHRVRIRIITGASGGGINAVLAARALNFRFPHAALNSDVWKTRPSSNPFYEVWVNDIDIVGLLDVSDLAAHHGAHPPIVSILNGNVLTAIAENALGSATLPGFPSQAQTGVTPTVARSWIYNPLTVIVTHTNLSGVPYSQMFTSASTDACAEYFTNHADYVRLYVGYSPSPDSPVPGIRYLPDAKFVNVPSGFKDMATVPPGFTETPWSALSQNVLGTSAFPLGFPARVVQRDATNYAYRFAWNSLAGRYDWLTPLWPNVAQPEKLCAYAFMSLDGGCTDNEPIMLAAQALEGLERSPHHVHLASGIQANRAIVLVDPLCDPLPKAVAPGVAPLISLLSPTLQMFIQSNRFATADIAGFLSKDVYNRFLIAPKRTYDVKRADGKLEEAAVAGGAALCAEGMGAFMGFLCRAFRHHDFMLGRRNCQAFLTGTFTLDKRNPIFQGIEPKVPEALRAAGCPEPEEDNECPIIPLCGSAAHTQPQVEWPVDAFQPEAIRDKLEARVDVMLSRLGGYLELSKPGEFLAGLFDRVILGPGIARKIVKYMRSELIRKQLLTTVDPVDTAPNGGDPLP